MWKAILQKRTGRGHTTKLCIYKVVLDQLRLTSIFVRFNSAQRVNQDADYSSCESKDERPDRRLQSTWRPLSETRLMSSARYADVWPETIRASNIIIIHSSPDTTQTGPSCRVWRAV